VPQHRPGAGSGRPGRFVIDGGTVLGVVLLLIVAFGAYELIAPTLFGNSKIERRIRSAHPEFTNVSCKLVQRSLDGNSYACVAHSARGVSCVSVTFGSLIDVSRPTSRPGKRPSC